MPIDPEINKILKEMWRLDEKITSGESLDDGEKDFYNAHLPVIASYYSNNNDYWSNRDKIQ